MASWLWLISGIGGRVWVGEMVIMWALDDHECRRFFAFAKYLFFSGWQTPGSLSGSIDRNLCFRILSCVLAMFNIFLSCSQMFWIFRNGILLETMSLLRGMLDVRRVWPS